MSLKSRVDEVLDSADWLSRTSGGEPALSALSDGPVVMTIYAGYEIIGPRAREAIDVVMLFGVAESKGIHDGEGVGPAVDRMVELIYEVNDAYPELRAARFSPRFDAFGSNRRYVAAVIRVLGD